MKTCTVYIYCIIPYANSYSDNNYHNNNYEIMMKAWNTTEYNTNFLVYLTRYKCQHFQNKLSTLSVPNLSLCVSWRQSSHESLDSLIFCLTLRTLSANTQCQCKERTDCVDWPRWRYGWMYSCEA